MAWVSELILGTSIDGYIGCSRAVQSLDLTNALPEIRVPTLIIPGQHDQSFPEKISRAIQEKILNSDLVLLEGAAHLGNVEQTHPFNELVMRFLDRLPN
jgi:3-oxoadipate enol-lactonase